MRWTRTLGLGLICLWVVLTAIFAWLTFSAAFGKDSSFFARALVVVVNLAALAVGLALAEDVVVPGRRFRGLLRPRPIAGLYAASFFAAGVVSGLLGLLEPKTATSRDVTDVGDRLEKVIKDQATAKPPKPSLIRQRIGRHLWGRDNCTITFAITVKDQAVLVRGVKQPPGFTGKYRMDARISAERDKELETVGQGAHRGAAGAFRYETDGVTEQLTWQDGLMGPDPTVLDSCGETNS